MVYAVIVTFNPVVLNVLALVNILSDCDVVPIVIDNNSEFNFKPNCELIKLSSNEGIAFAQNVGIKKAIIKGANQIVFFDQDSILPNVDFIDKLVSPISNKLTSITAPIFIDEVRGFTYPIVNINKSGTRTKFFPKSNDKPFFVNNVISSGTMVDVEVFNTVGLMKDEIFIDYVDTEWCLRCTAKDYLILVIPSAIMYHSIGDSSFSLLGFNIPKHSPSRRYYRIRNSFYLIRQKHIPKLMAIREILFSIIHQSLLIIFSKGEKRSYFNTLIRGVKDGIIGKFGRY